MKYVIDMMPEPYRSEWERICPPCELEEALIFGQDALRNYKMAAIRLRQVHTEDDDKRG